MSYTEKKVLYLSICLDFCIEKIKDIAVIRNCQPVLGQESKS